MLNAGEVAEGETIVTPFGIATLLAIAVVTPEQSAPMMPATLSEVISLSAAAVAAAASIHVESARTILIFCPPSSWPESEASLKANSAELPMSGVSDSIGPVKPKMIPILISAVAKVGMINAPTDNSKSLFRMLFFFIIPLIKKKIVFL